MRRKLILLASLMMPAFLCAQSVHGGKKVKREKTEKSAIAVVGGIENMSIGDYSGSGSTFGGYFMYQGLLKPRNPECRWAFEVGFGLSVSTANLEYDGKNKKSFDEEEVTTFRMFDIPCNIKYSLNPLSTRGKWYLKAGLSVCPLAYVPKGEKKGSLGYTHLDNGSLAVSAGINAGIAYEAKHWGFGLNGFAGIASSYSTDTDTDIDSDLFKSYGTTITLKYLF